MTNFRAVKEADRGSVFAHVATHYTIFVDDPFYPYSLGCLKLTHETGVWTVYCLSRRDIGMGLVPSTDFATREAALAFVREQYEAAKARYDEHVDGVMAKIRANLSPVEMVGKSDYGLDTVLVGLIFDSARYSIRTRMTVQEALTAMDLASEGLGAVPTIDGCYRGGQTQMGFAKWEVPYGATDYHIAGWRSTTGKGREHTNAFYAAIYNPKKAA